ncbi:MAG: hypothetical protein J6Q29_02110 [Alistipes sp.]|nr:hypothetical protein [Alistipes sp.]
MDFETVKDILLFVGGCGSSMVAWFFAHRKQKNDFLSELQKSIDLLTEKYTETLNENVQLKADNAKLLANQQVMEGKIDSLTRKIDSLTKQLKNYEKNNQGIPPYASALARNDLSGIVQRDQINELEVRDDGRGSAGGRKCRNSGRNRTRRAALRTPSGGDSTDDNEVGGHGGGTCTDELTDGADSEPP